MFGLTLGFIPMLGCTDTGSTGDGGTGGEAGSAGTGGEACGVSERLKTSCLPVPTTCTNTAVQPIKPCCSAPAPPTQEDACQGDESLENPESCSRTGVTTVHRLTSLEVAPDCNVGFELDACDGLTCRLGSLATEGRDGVDNMVATIERHDGINQLFADAICGSRDTQGLGCDTSIPRLDLELAIEENPTERCANVVVIVGVNEMRRVRLNLGEPTLGGTRCASGRLGGIPLTLGNVQITLSHASVRMTVSGEGLSHGLLGATIHADDAASLADAAIPELGADIAEYFDICDNLSFAPAGACNALSGSYKIAGVAEESCPAPLSDYCEGSGCPTYEDGVEMAREWRCEDISDWAEVGTCGGLSYVRLGLGIGSGQEQYYDAGGLLTAIYFHADTPTYCGATAFGKWYGSATDCEQTPTEIFCAGGI